MGTRAGNQRSSIFQGDDGRWYGFVTMGPSRWVRPDGSVDRRKRMAKTRPDAVPRARASDRSVQATASADWDEAPALDFSLDGDVTWNP
jgi:integrase